jgi:hypothetical protein
MEVLIENADSQRQIHSYYEFSVTLSTIGLRSEIKHPHVFNMLPSNKVKKKFKL